MISLVVFPSLYRPAISQSPSLYLFSRQFCNPRLFVISRQIHLTNIQMSSVNNYQPQAPPMLKIDSDFSSWRNRAIDYVTQRGVGHYFVDVHGQVREIHQGASQHQPIRTTTQQIILISQQHKVSLVHSTISHVSQDPTLTSL